MEKYIITGLSIRSMNILQKEESIDRLGKCLSGNIINFGMKCKREVIAWLGTEEGKGYVQYLVNKYI